MVFGGGLGNQMFQYAFMLHLRKNGFGVVADTSLYNYVRMHQGYELERVFGIQEDIFNKGGVHLLWLRFLIKYHPRLFITIDPLCYKEDNINRGKKYIYGFWQDERYFDDVKNEIKRSFVFQDIDGRNRAVAEAMYSCNSVSVHIRRGDYASYGMPIMDDEYYKKAILYVNGKIEAPSYYVFSDDHKVAEKLMKNLNVDYNIVDWNNGTDSYKDMYLMSQCKYNIIANSSFSWWGAWLNNYTGKMVVAPKVWSPRAIHLRPQMGDWILI